MLGFALVLSVLSVVPQRHPEPFASYAVPTQQISISPNGAVAAIVSNATAIRMDPRTQKAEELAEGGEVASVALGYDSYTLGLRDGRIVHFDANGTRHEYDVGRTRTVLGLQRHGDLLAWWTTESRANVLDLKTGAQRFDPPLEVSVHMQYPAVRFAADGKFLCLRERSNRPEASSYVRVLDCKDGAEVARLPCYSTNGDDFVLAGSRVVHAQRLDTKTWNLLAFDLDARESKVLDADLRGGHFVDLFASPSGRFVVEGDFEEKGIARYGFADQETARVEFEPELGAVGCGSLRVGSDLVEVVFAQPRHDRGELIAIRLDDLTRVDARLPRTGEPGLDVAGTFADGLGMWHCDWAGAGPTRTRRMHFFSLDPDAKAR